MSAENFRPRIVAFCCENSGLMAAELASQGNLAFPADVDIITLPCSGQADVRYFLKALVKGADGAIVMACHQENCKFLRGNNRAAKRVLYTRTLLGEAGIGEERVAIGYVAANQGHRFAEIILEMAMKLKEIGPNPGKVRK